MNFSVLKILNMISSNLSITAFLNLEKRVRLFLFLSFCTISMTSKGQLIVDSCFASSTPGTQFVSSADLFNTASSDLLTWTGANWTGGWPGANLSLPPHCGAALGTGYRAVFIGSGTTWTTGGEGFALRLNAPLVSGQTYSYAITYVSHGTGSNGSFSPRMYTGVNGTMAGAVAMANLPPAGYAWLATNYTFTATPAQNGHTYLIIRTTSTESSGLIGSFCSNCAIPLPVELFKFDFQCEENKPQLIWATNSETNNDYFTIAHSTNGIDFSTVAKIEGKGNSQQEHRYSLSVEEYYVQGAINYYRLSQTDFNGSTREYQTIAGSGCVIEKSYAYFSNGSLHIRGNDIQKVLMYDGMGKLVHTETMNAQWDGKLSGISSELTAGMYQLVIYHEDTSIENLKVVIQ